MENSKETSRDLFPGALEMMILESLRRQPAHGYALVQHIQQRSLVRAEWTVSSSTNRRVRVYEITRSGLRHLEREISSFDRMLEGIQMVLGPTKDAASS
jgi:PadR family transcriptional regulator PadR